MEILAYAAFIIVLALPFLVIGAIAKAFVFGVAGIVQGTTGGGLSRALFGIVLVIASGAATVLIAYWALSPPTQAATSPHRFVYRTHQELRMQFLALRWLSDGTAKRLTEQQRSAADPKR